MNKMKNMLVIKNLKSNLVEEAIVVFKKNVRIKEENTVNSKLNLNKEKELSKNVYILEAENIVSEYIENLNKKQIENNNKKKINFLKILNIVLVIAIIMVALI